MQLSTGPWSYNRFAAYEQSLTEGAKPDFLDMDKDGDKEEPMKKAIKEKGSKKCDDCGSEDCDCDDKKKDVKEGNCYQEGGKVKANSHLNKNVKAKPSSDEDSNLNVKEALINSIMGDGLANNPVSAEIIVEHMSDEWKEAILQEL